MVEAIARIFVLTPIIAPAKKEWFAYRYFVKYDYSDAKVFKKEELTKDKISELNKEGFVKLTKVFPRIDPSNINTIDYTCLNNAVYVVIKKKLEENGYNVKKLHILDFLRGDSKIDLGIVRNYIKVDNNGVPVVYECIKPGSVLVYKLDLDIYPNDNNVTIEGQIGGRRKFGMGKCRIEIEFLP